MQTEFLIDGPKEASTTFLFCHGAGAPMDTGFMTSVAKGVAARGIGVLRFEFPYMAKRRADGKRRGPDRAPVLLQSLRDAIADAGVHDRLVIGGKSMGGRMAATLACEEAETFGIAAAICFGYPFHPPGKPERLRLEPLQRSRTPVLVIQGERDPFGGKDEVAGYDLPSAVRLAWMADGDHSLVPRKSSGGTEAENLEAAVAAAAGFIDTLS